jgi:outer membrane protein assembly factor BamD (BamD/ComL family)
VLTEPNDTVVVALLLHGKEVQRLKQRKQQLEPALARWRQSLSDAQMKEASARIDTVLDHSQFIKDMNWLETDATNVTRFKRNPALRDLIMHTVLEIVGR